MIDSFLLVLEISQILQNEPGCGSDDSKNNNCDQKSDQSLSIQLLLWQVNQRQRFFPAEAQSGAMSELAV